jgi:hypothetical protein
MKGRIWERMTERGTERVKSKIEVEWKVIEMGERGKAKERKKE